MRIKIYNRVTSRKGAFKSRRSDVCMSRKSHMISPIPAEIKDQLVPHVINGGASSSDVRGLHVLMNPAISILTMIRCIYNLYILVSNI